MHSIFPYFELKSSRAITFEDTEICFSSDSLSVSDVLPLTSSPNNTVLTYTLHLVSDILGLITRLDQESSN